MNNAPPRLETGCDLLIRNVIVWGGNPPRPDDQWIAIQAGRVHALGGSGTTPPKAKRQIDGHGKTILPSFVDCHTHISAGSIASICRSGAHLNSREDALESIATAAKTDPSDWLVMFYVDWNAWENPIPPTAAELEEASNGRKVILICESLHRAILSESGLRACNVSRFSHTAFVETSRGVLNGTVWEEVFSFCLEQVMGSIIASLGEKQFADVLLAEANRHLAYGITDAHDPCVTFEMSDAMAQLNQHTPLRISWSEVGNMGPLSTAGTGQPLQDFGAGPSSAKVFTDGAHRCAMCIEPREAIRMTLGLLTSAVTQFKLSPLRQLVTDETAYRRGHFYRKGALFEPDELTHKLEALGETHNRLKIHALGNHAVDMTCDCILESGITTKVCLEHATIVDDQNIDKLAKLGVQVSVQPGFLPHFGDQFETMRLTGRYRGLACQSMLQAGVDLILSSDYPCGPLDPLHNLRCAVDRQLRNGRVYLEQECISREAAVYAYTIAGAKGINGAPKQGLVENAPADFVLLTGDPFAPSTRVDSTWIEGRAVYQA